MPIDRVRDGGTLWWGIAAMPTMLRGVSRPMHACLLEDVNLWKTSEQCVRSRTVGWAAGQAQLCRWVAALANEVHATS